MKVFVKTILLVLIIAQPYIFSQESVLLKELKENFKTRYFNAGLFFQTVTDFQHERTLSGTNGFNLTNIRLKISGELDEGFGYSMQTNFINAKPILDAFIYHKFSKVLRIDVGQFKAPFSSEYLTSSTQLDFVKRSQVTSTYSPKRQIGFQVRGDIVSNVVSVFAGMFNGNGINTPNDDGKFMYVGRVLINPAIGEKANLTISGNAAYDDVTSTSFSGKKVTVGADLKLIVNDFMASGEVIIENSKPDSGDTFNNAGYQFTAAYHLTQSVQILGRIDILKPDALLGKKNSLAILGCNYWPTEVTKVQFNYIINTEHTQPKFNQVLLAAQLAF